MEGITDVEADRREFETFVGEVEPRLRRAFTLMRGPEDGRDATAEALAWAWANWPSVRVMSNATGYLYRVGNSRSRRRKPALLAPSPPSDDGLYEPGLVPALARLTDRQRTVVVLVHGCGWTHREVADALELSRSSVGTHVERAMAQLRTEMGVEIDD